jgi:hypothetical protein
MILAFACFKSSQQRAVGALVSKEKPLPKSSNTVMEYDMSANNLVR